MRTLLAMGLLMCAQAFAVPLTEDQADSIFAVAYGQYGSAHGGIPWPDRRPIIRMMPRADLCTAHKLKPDCRMYAEYRDGEVHLADDLDFASVDDASILMHEYIHFFQERHQGGPAKDCWEHLEREHEAYQLQAHVLLKSNRPSKAQEVLFVAGLLRC